MWSINLNWVCWSKYLTTHLLLLTRYLVAVSSQPLHSSEQQQLLFLSRCRSLPGYLWYSSYLRLCFERARDVLSSVPYKNSNPHNLPGCTSVFGDVGNDGIILLVWGKVARRLGPQLYPKARCYLMAEKGFSLLALLSALRVSSTQILLCIQNSSRIFLQWPSHSAMSRQVPEDEQR